MPLRALVLVAPQAAALPVRDGEQQLLKALWVAVYLFAEGRRLLCGALPVAKAVGGARKPELKPEHGPLTAAVLALKGKPKVVVVGAAAEEPPGVPVYP